MTNLQNAILEASNNDIITSSEASSLLNMTEAVIPCPPEKSAELREYYKRVVDNSIRQLEFNEKDINKEYAKEIKGWATDKTWAQHANSLPPDKEKEAKALKEVKARFEDIIKTMDKYWKDFEKKLGDNDVFITGNIWVNTGLLGNKSSFVSKWYGFDENNMKIPMSEAAYYWGRFMETFYNAYIDIIFDDGYHRYGSQSYFDSLNALKKQTKILEKLKEGYMRPLNMK